MPGLDGIGVLEAMRERGIALPVIVQTAQGGIETVVSAMRTRRLRFRRQAGVAGAAADRDRQCAQGRGAGGRGAARSRRRGGRRARASRTSSRSSPAMDRVIRLGQKAAASNIPILIEGESGVGKELVARAIQGSGDRRSKPFVTVNCGAIPDNLVESILFGHEKGSFTGATEKHTGKFVEAHSRHAVPRRDRRPAARRAGQAAARRAGRRGRSGRRHARPSRSTSG